MNRPIERYTHTLHRLASAGLLAAAALLPATGHAHNVGQVQTTIYFAPETINLLTSRAAAGGVPGFQANDIVSYIISFQPVPNPGINLPACTGAGYASTGVNGYITDYIPPNTQVVGASFVNADGVTLSAPNAPGPMVEATALGVFTAPFAGALSGALPDLYADTGIFYSTDPRTALDPTTVATGNIAKQGQPGYNVIPTRGGCLAKLIDPAIATMTTHNLWDADQTTAFGTTTANAALVVAPKSAAPVSIAVGSGVTPLNAGSPVAGPDSGFKLDNTGFIGPWQRISTPGATIGCAAGCAAAVRNTAVASVRATPTAQGYNLSVASPLPANTNAVRWAAGQLVVGQPRYVKLSLRLLGTPAAGGVINSAEVSGGDSDGLTSRDNPWTYWVASTANNNSSLFIQKQITNVCTTAQYAALAVGQDASSCPAYNGGNIPANAVLRYRIAYSNLSNSVQHQVVLSDILPIQTNVPPNLPATPATLAQLPTLVKNFAYTGYNLSSVAPAYPAFTAGTATTSPVVTFAPISSLGPALGGTISFDVILSTPTVPTTVSNTAKITTFEIPTGTSASTSASVTVAPAASLAISKTALTNVVAPGGTVSYAITLTNNGSGPATLTNIVDTLPGFGNATGVAATDALTQFVYVGPSTYTNGAAGLPTAITGTVTQPAANSANQDRVTFTFPAATTLAAGATLTLTFNATVGANVPAAASPYNNTVTTTYTGGAVGTVMPVYTGAPVTVGNALTISKKVDCVYAGASCVPYVANTPLPLNAKVRYRIDYANTANVAVNNVYICDEIASTQTAPLFNLSTVANAPLANTAVLSNGVPVTPTLPAAPVPAAIAACGFAAAASNKLNFNYPVINPLDAGQAGVLYYEATTNVPVAATATTLSNTAKIISSASVTGPASTSVSASVATPVQSSGAILNVSKAVMVPLANPAGHAYPGDLVDYTITVTNVGSAATGASTAAAPLTVVDTLPGSGATNVLANRFTYLAAPPLPGAAPAYKLGAGAPTAFATAPTVLVTAATNSEAVTFTLPVGTSIPAGGSLTITFTAQVGTTMPPSTAALPSYNNSATVSYLNGATATTTPALVGAAPVIVDTPLQAIKSIDCLYDALGVCQPYVAGSDIPVNFTTATSTKIRYKIAYANLSPTAVPFVFICDQLSSTQAAPAFTSPITAPLAPPANTPAPNGPSTAVINTPTAVAACGYGAVAAGKVQASFAVITSLAGNASGVVYLDATTNVATAATLINSAKLVSATTAAGTVASNKVSSLSTVVSTAGAANLVVNKTANKSNSFGGDTVIYTISVSNTGTGPATMGTIVDTLPGTGISNNIPLRFSYVAASVSAINNGVATVAPTAVVTVPANNAVNNETVTFTLPAGTVLAAGKTLTLTFSAKVGVNVPAGLSYTNTATVNYTGGAPGVLNTVVTGAAPVLVGGNPLTVSKRIDCVYDAAVPAVCQPYVAGTALPVNAKIRYRIDYANTSATPIANVYLCDKLSSTQTAPLFNLSTVANAAVANTAVMSGGVAVTPTLPAAPIPPAVAACGFGAATTNALTFNYPLLPMLDANQSGTVFYEATTNAVNSATINNLVNINTVTLPADLVAATSNSGGISATVVAAPVTTANLLISKAVAVPPGNTAGHAFAGNTVTYTITVQNTGAAPGVLSTIVDKLPGAGITNVPAARFSYVAASVSALNNGVAIAAPTAVITAPAAGTNSDTVTFTLPAATSVAAGTSLTLTFNALVGASVPASPTPYNNTATVNYTGGPVGVLAASTTGAPVTVDSPLQASKTLDCIYDAANICQPYTGTGTIPANAVSTKVRYKIVYSNISAAPVANVYVCDQLTSTQTAPVFTATVSTPATPASTLVLPAAPAAAVAACGFAAGGVTFNYPVIASLAPNVLGTLYYDALTNVANGSILSNTVKLVSSATAAGPAPLASAPATVSSYAVNIPNLSISKTTATATTSPSGTVSYTITLSNTGNAPTTSLKVYDFLPFNGSVADATRRFNYVATSAYTKATTAQPTPAAFVPAAPFSITPVVAPAVTPYSANPNQQQVTWDFGSAAANQLAPGDTLTISFTATAGSAMPLTAYNNSAGFEFTSSGGPGSNNVNGLATVTLAPMLTVSKKIIAVCGGAGCTPGAYTPGALLPPNALIRYQIDYANPDPLNAHSNVVLSDVLPVQTGAAAVSNVVVVSGPVAAPSAATLSALAAGGATLSFPTLASLPANASGSITLDVQTTATAGMNVNNTARLLSAQLSTPVSSTASATVTDLELSKTIVGVCSGAGCTPLAYTPGALIPANAKIRYQLAYRNASATVAQTNVVLSDVLPAQTAAAAVSNVVVVSGPVTAPSAATLSALGAGGATLSFPMLASLPVGSSGVITLDVQTNAGLASKVSNTARLLSTQDAVGVSSTVAASTPDLLLSKTLIGVCAGAACTPAAYTPGAVIPPNAKLRYQISYSNASTVAAQTNVVLSDVLPAQTAAASVSNVVIVSGPIAAPSAATLSALAAGGATLNFPALASLAANTGGVITLDVQTNAAAGVTVSNTAKLVSAEDTTGQSSTASADVTNLLISKTTSTAQTLQGGVASYTITITNASTVSADSLQVYDFLPFNGATADVNQRFSLVAGSSVYSGGLPPATVPLTAIPPTQAPYSANSNQQEVLWDFGTFVLGAGASVTLTFNATVGSALPLGSYSNSALVAYKVAGVSRASSIDGTAAVQIVAKPTINLSKVVKAYSDPVFGTTNPRFLPGGLAEYTVTASNAGGAADGIVIEDFVPANTTLYVRDLAGVGSGPVVFGAGASGLSYQYLGLSSLVDDLEFFNGTVWTAVPAPGADGCDPTITKIRVKPTGTFAGNITTPPSFTVSFRVCVQ